MYIVCQFWALSLISNGLPLSLIDIIVKYAYTKYDWTCHNNRQNMYDYSFKILLVGPESTGKTSIFRRFCDDTFINGYIPTIGIDFRYKTIEFQQKRLTLNVWDSAGQQRFRQITNSYCKAGANGIFIVFDITNRQSFDALNQQWILDIPKLASRKGEYPTVLMLIGSKCDMVNDRKVTENEATEWAERMGYMEYIEVSAKDEINIDHCFNQMVRHISMQRVRLDENKPFLYPCT